MDKRIWAIAGALGLAIGVLSAPASAAPALGSAAGGVKAALGEAGAAEPVRWVDRCWRDRSGRRHCRQVWLEPRRMGSGFYYGGGHRHFRGHGYRGHDGMRGDRGRRGGDHMRGSQGRRQ